MSFHAMRLPTAQRELRPPLLFLSYQEWIYIMKLIVAIVQPARMETVKAALSQVEILRVTVMDVQGYGQQ